jgi:hypothetical protein
VKVEAQYPAAAGLGNHAKEMPVLAGTIENVAFWSRTPLSDCQYWSIVPSGTDSSLKTLTQSAAADTGLLSSGPAGLIL